MVAVLGPSGGGKTTFIRFVACVALSFAVFLYLRSFHSSSVPNLCAACVLRTVSGHADHSAYNIRGSVVVDGQPLTPKLARFRPVALAAG